MKTYGKLNDYERLKGELSAYRWRSVYILYGTEDFLMEEAVSLLQKQQEKAGGGSDVARVDGATNSLEAVLDMADTVSLFGKTRLLLVTNAPYFSKEYAGSTGIERLRALSARDGGDSRIVFYATDFNKTIKIHKELMLAGLVYNFEPLKPSATAAWLKEKLNRQGKTAAPQVLDSFILRVGRDLRRLSGELDKLITYLGEEKELTEKVVLLASSRSLHGDIFALMDAVAYGQAPKSLALLRDLLVAGEPPLRILAMLVRQFRLLGEACEQMRRGCARPELASRLGIHPFAAEKLAAQAQRIDENRLYRAVELMLQADLDMKRGRIEHALALETLVVALGEKNA